MENREVLIEIIKEQVRLFLLDSGGFFPFGTCIDKQYDIKPLSAYVEDESDSPTSLSLVNLLEKHIKNELLIGNCLLGAIVIDVALKESAESIDAVELRFFTIDKMDTLNLKYKITKDSVDFF